MAVLPANQRVSVRDLCALTASDDVTLAREDEFRDVFPDYELGAMPPFGNLFDISVYVSPELASRDEIIFNAGTHPYRPASDGVEILRTSRETQRCLLYDAMLIPVFRRHESLRFSRRLIFVCW